jgi:hypothetical protein
MPFVEGRIARMMVLEAAIARGVIHRHVWPLLPNAF